MHAACHNAPIGLTVMQGHLDLGLCAPKMWGPIAGSNQFVVKLSANTTGWVVESLWVIVQWLWHHHHCSSTVFSRLLFYCMSMCTVLSASFCQTLW